jgi:hypothetical protein
MRLSLALCTFLLALPAVAPASAQVTLGLRGGLNTAFFTGGDAAGTDPRLGAVGGAFVRYDVTPRLGLQVEALYSQEGAEDDVIGQEGTYKFDYIDIPVLVRLGVPVSRFADAGVYAGPSFGIPVRDDFVDAIDGFEDEQGAATDVGLVLGADYWAGPFGVDLRYTAGLTDAFSDEIDGELVEPLDIRNAAFSVTLGLRFGAPERDRPRRRPGRPY